MKKIIYTGFLLLAYMLTSCSGFLDKEPYEDPSAETINDEASAIAMTNAAYQPMQRPKLYNMRIWALDIVAGEAFDLVLMDCQMPVMDGYEAAKRLRASGHGLPILAMTANAFAEDVQKSMAAGMDGHLAKPIKPELLYETILGFCRPEEGVPVFPDLK